jgi:hypothetical protein
MRSYPGSPTLERGWASPPAIPVYADLEICLRPRTGDYYAVELRLTRTQTDDEVRLPRGEPHPVCIDEDFLKELRVCSVDTLSYGIELGKRIFADAELLRALDEALKVAASHGVPLRVRLYLSPTAAALHNLRWETICHPTTEQPLTTSGGVLFSRYLSGEGWRTPDLGPRAALRALVVAAGPSDLKCYGFDPVDPGTEVERAR